MTTKKFKNKLSSNNSIVHSKFRMDIEKYLYYGKFTGNILVLGQTGCGKTNFVQNFGKKQYVWKIWVTIIMLSKEGEHQIKSCFNVPAKFFYLQNVCEFNIVIKNFQRKKENTS